MKKKTIFGLAVMLLFTASAAFAGTANKDMNVSATVVADCVVDSGGSMAFSSTLGIPFTINHTDDTTNTKIYYTCTNTGVPVKIKLGQGANSDDGSTEAAPLRRMLHGTIDYISYELHQNSSTGPVWGNTDATAGPGVADGNHNSVTVYGVAKAANVPAGDYKDTVVVTIEF